MVLKITEEEKYEHRNCKRIDYYFGRGECV